MKNFVFLFLICIFILIIGIVIPKTIIHNSSNVSLEDIKCAEIAVNTMYDHPVQRLLIMKVAVKDKKEQILSVDVYTFWGIKYSTLEIDSNNW